MSDTARKRYSTSELLKLHFPLLLHHDLKPGETLSKRSARLVEDILRDVLVVYEYDLLYHLSKIKQYFVPVAQTFQMIAERGRQS
jgi:hypothetical protein